MTRQTATGHAIATAPAASLWALLEDVTTWTTWAPFETAVLELPGQKDPHGVGAIRRFQRGRFTTREQVTEFVPDRRLSYRLLSGLPLRNYEAHIDLERQQDRTHITWSASFDARIPGTGGVFRRGMQKLYTDYAQRLAGAAAEPSELDLRLGSKVYGAGCEHVHDRGDGRAPVSPSTVRWRPSP